MAEPRKNAGPARAAAAKKATGRRRRRRKAVAKKAPAKKAPAKRATAKQAAPVAATPVAEAPERRSTPLAASGSTWSLAYRVTAVVLVLAAFLLLLKLNDQERGGPAHGEFSFGDGIPATLYLPVDAEDDGDLPEPLPKGERPPVIVMAHGYSADRASMSGMARSLAKAGYAVVNIDLRGHGSNTHAFRGDLRDDFAAAVDWATTTPWVDGSRLAVLGHSMGAGAALDFATVDNRAKAVVPVSGGWVANDAVTPAHTLFLVGSGDPDRIAERQDTLARELRNAGGQVTEREISRRPHHDPPRRRHHRCDHGVPRPAPRHPPRRAHPGPRRPSDEHRGAVPARGAGAHRGARPRRRTGRAGAGQRRRRAATTGRCGRASPCRRWRCSSPCRSWPSGGSTSSRSARDSRS